MTAWQAPWDTGITWKTERVSVNASFRPFSVAFASERILRTVTDQLEDGLVDDLILAATELCERESGSLIRPAQHRMLLSGFPCGSIVLPDAPVREVLSIDYVDADGATQVYGGSPPSWNVVTAGRFGKATIELGVGESWPSARTQGDGVVVTYTVGYETPDEIPPLTKQAIALVVAELYKSPDLSNGDGQVANVLGLSRFLPRRW